MKSEILFLLTAEFPFGTGETFIENEINYLADAFDKIVILPFNQSSENHRFIPSNVILHPIYNRQIRWTKVFDKIFSEPGIIREFILNIFSNPLKNKILLKSIRNAINISENLKLQIAEFKSSENYFYSYWLDDGAVGIALLNKNVRKFSRTHGWDVYFERHPYNYLPLRRFLIEKLDRIFSISENGKSYLDNKFDTGDKIDVSRLGTLNEYPVSGKTDNEELNIISIGNVIELKRINLIGEAVKLLNGDNILWNHFGDGSLLEKIKRQFPFAIFHGRISNNEIKRLLKQYSLNSVLINTSVSEGIPVSMMEAMSFGIPCIGTNVGGVSEIIENNVNGFLMPAKPTANEVANYIQKYTNLSVEEKNLFRSNAYKTWDNKYNAGKNYKDFVAKIKSLGLFGYN